MKTNRTFPRAQDEVRENIRPSDLLDIGYLYWNPRAQGQRVYKTTRLQVLARSRTSSLRFTEAPRTSAFANRRPLTPAEKGDMSASRQVEVSILWPGNSTRTTVSTMYCRVRTSSQGLRRQSDMPWLCLLPICRSCMPRGREKRVPVCLRVSCPSENIRQSSSRLNRSHEYEACRSTRTASHSAVSDALAQIDGSRLASRTPALTVHVHSAGAREASTPPGLRME